ncbi:hypothetical protein EXIGLDRAFT_645875 [Exidia glandulosa HHB12029]|uniref:Uncharacterized protein n=1 Tax=Exidia glandulosa HHB12029 TaxID=1314781 RepID=A0A165IRW9_EXIGL|nr:hypothetical protein EXIGLDRAFT_645875 [Exidia glandulosa HHB12029]
MVRERDTTPPSRARGEVIEIEDTPERPTRATRRSGRVLDVVVPRLSDGDKNDYAALNTPPDDSDSEEDGDDDAGPVPATILGEIRRKSEMFYFVLHDDDVIRRYSARDVKAHYPKLVDEYETSKDDDSLEPFNYNDSRIEAKSRDSHVSLPIAKKKAQSKADAKSKSKSKSKAADSKDATHDYRDTDEESSDPSSEENSGGSDYEHEEEAPAPRRSTRSAVVAPKAKQKAKEKAPSPKKATRTSGRARNAVTYGGMQAPSDVESDVDMSDEEAPAPTAKDKKAPRPRKKHVSRPAYGNIRHTKELSDDEDDDRDRLHVHREGCEKCGEPPAHVQVLDQRRKKRRKKGKRKAAHSSDEDDELSDDEMDFDALGGWIRCLKCCVVSHWKCLSAEQRNEILRAVKEKDTAVDEDGKPLPKRKKLEVFETTEFVCASCSKGGICFMCNAVAVEKFQPQTTSAAAPPTSTGEPASEDVEMKDNTAQTPDAPKTDDASDKPLLFRCITCKRAAHYDHLLVPDASDVQEIAMYYQDDQDWTCDDCKSFVYGVENILAWRPYPADAVEPPLDAGEVPNHKNMLPREYLVKWEGRSYKRVQWVPHMWLLATAPAKLKGFITRGSLVKLLAPTAASGAPSKRSTPFLEEASGRPSPAPSDDIGEREFGPPASSSDAFDRIPRQWYTIERVLDVQLWCPPGCGQKQKQKQKRRDSGKRVVDDDEDVEMDDDSDSDAPEGLAEALATARAEGDEPESKKTQTVAGWEKRHGRELTERDIGLVVWGYFKYTDLSYDQGTWDAPPSEDDDGYVAFKRAFKGFIAARSVLVKEKGTGRKLGKFEPLEGQPKLCEDDSFALRDFQLDGLNWLYYNWHKGHSSILADEMGLGKTVQMTTLLGLLVKHHDAFPLLVIVPNSTLSNWLREFERWAPNVRVVPFYGEGKSRDIIKKYELYHDYVPKGYTSSKFHVLLSTYESFTNVKDGYAVFTAVKYWEAIVVDEGQRLKSDASLLFRRLTSLNARHRILMTGTPLNNNIRELFNLMNFLDPKEWADLPALEEKYSELTEESVKELHERLKPYFLRRTKADVLKLPPKNELIVPVSMSALQKTVYKSVIGQNAELLQALLQGKNGAKNNKAKKLNNILMQLRKCIQHPYLVDRELEPSGLDKKDTHRNLVDASSKLQLLKVMLPQLKQRGHRVLLFSQFRIALDIIEDFLVAEGHTFRRLDGETKQADRQKYMDEFNAEDSDVFIFILSTRAGGVGINLFTADTVIVFDPDYNPHQDPQAIARAHRFGQKKTVLVFKLMMKDSAEEKIMQAGKKKLALDHLIVQSMDDENAADNDVQTLLSYGAKALFEEDGAAQTITYSASDVEQLIVRTETAVDVEQDETTKGSLSFDFTKIWLPEKGGVEELQEDTGTTSQDEHDFWAKTLALASAEQEAAKERERQQMGRGARRRKEVNYAMPVSPEKDKRGKGRKRNIDDDDDDEDVDFTMQDGVSSDDDTASFYGGDVEDRLSLDEPAAHAVSGLAASGPNQHTAPGAFAGVAAHVDVPVLKKKVKKRKLVDQENVSGLDDMCGLCHQRHPAKSCYMTNNPLNLIEYRKILFDDQNDEPYETRAAAVQAIDRELNARGMSSMLKSLPAFPAEPIPLPTDHKAKKRKTDPGPLTTALPKPPVLSDAAVNSRPTTVSGPVPPLPSPFTSAPLPTTSHAKSAVTDPAAVKATSSPAPVVLPKVKAPVAAPVPPKVSPPAPMVASDRVSTPAADVGRAGTPGMRQTTLSFGRKDSKTSVARCPVCNQSAHPVLQCPDAQDGTSIRAAIERLKGKPEHQGTVDNLRQLFADRFIISSSHKPAASSSSQTEKTASRHSYGGTAAPSESSASLMRRKSNPKPVKSRPVVDEDVIEISD